MKMNRFILILLLICFSVGGANAQANGVQARNPVKIVVLPFYADFSGNLQGSTEKNFYSARRLMGVISKQLNKNAFEVINPVAYENALRDVNVNNKNEDPELSSTQIMLREYEKFWRLGKQSSVHAAKAISRRYGADVAYVSWVRERSSIINDGRCSATVTVEGEGYDSAGNDLGIGCAYTVEKVAENCDDAISAARKSAGENVALTIAGLDIERLDNIFTLRLDGVVEWEVVSFIEQLVGDLKGVGGIREVQKYINNINQQNVRKGTFVIWRISGDFTDTIQMVSKISEQLDQVTGDGFLVINNEERPFTVNQRNVLVSIRPGIISNSEVQLVVDQKKLAALEGNKKKVGTEPEKILQNFE